MLKKLLKYDLKWVYKIIGIYYIIGILLSIFTRLFGLIDSSVLFDIVSKICSGALITVIINIFINNMMRLWARFNRNMYKDESYLTHTLPVERKDIYLSKIIASIILLLISTIVVIICLFIAYYSKENLELISSSLKLIASGYGTSTIKLLLVIVLVIFLEIMFMVMVGYLGLILGHKSNKGKMGKSVLYSIIIYFISQGLTLVSIVIYGLFNSEVWNLIKTVDVINISSMKSVLYLSVILYIVYILICYLIGLKSLEKGIDID